MKVILLLAGTSDARALAVEIKKQGYQLLATVVTENAAAELREAGIEAQSGRLTEAAMVSLIQVKEVQVVVDASHPFAEEASKNAMNAAKQVGIPYIRYERESQTFQYDKMIVAESYEVAAEIAATKRGCSHA